MANNTLTSMIPKILARGLMGLRRRNVMTRFVNTDYSIEAKEKGDTIDIPLSTAMTATDVTPANVPPDPTAITPGKVQIQLNNWKHVSFKLSDKDLHEINAKESFVPIQMSAAFEALATAINNSVIANYLGIYGVAGTAGTTPFASTVNSINDLDKVLNEQLCPLENRTLLLNYSAFSSAKSLSAFSSYNDVGNSETIIEGSMGKRFGFNIQADAYVPTHTSGKVGGEAGGKTIVKAATAHAVGVSAVTATVGSTNAMALLKGDIITFAGHSQTYVLTANASGAAAADVTLNISPTLQVALAGSEVITSVSGAGYTAGTNHVVNLGFHRDAFGLAIRAPGDGLKEWNIGESVTMPDPVTGLIFRLELVREYKQLMWDLDALWGTNLIRPEYAARLLG